MMTPKKKYAKPTVKVAKWELNEAICDNPVCLSYRKCIGISKGSNIKLTEDRNNFTGSWERITSK